MFFMNGWWYLVFSQFTDRFATCYRMSRSPRGPWIRPLVDTFDARAFYAAKTGTDGVHRYLYGWNPSKTQNTWGFNPNQYPRLRLQHLGLGWQHDRPRAVAA